MRQNEIYDTQIQIKLGFKAEVGNRYYINSVATAIC